MKIVRLKVRNFMGLRDVDVAAGPHLNVVKGSNGQGKTSLLQAILRAFKGGKADPWVIYRMKDGSVIDGNSTIASHAAVDAEILVELDGNMIVRRRIGDTGKSDLLVTKKEGPLNVEVRSPQAVLDALTGGTTLNPVEFFQANAADQKKILTSVVPAILPYAWVEEALKSAGLVPSDILKRANVTGKEALGLDDLQAIERAIMDERHEWFTVRKNALGAAEARKKDIPEGFDPSLPVLDVSALAASLEAALASVEKGAVIARDAADCIKEVGRIEDDIAATEKRLAQLKKALNDAADTADKKMKALEAARESAIDPDPIRDKLKKAQSLDRAATAWQDWKRSMDSADEAEAKMIDLDSVKETIRHNGPVALWDKMKDHPGMSADAKEVLGGIRIDEDRVTVGGVDLAKLSTSEKVRVAVQVAKATAGEIKVICVDRFESLDSDTKVAFAKECADDGFQYWVAEVSDGVLRVEGQ